MAHRSKWLRRIATLLWGGVVVLAALYWLVLPLYVEGRIRDKFREYGFHSASFSLESVGISRLVLRNVRAGHDLRAGSIVIEYELGDLLAGRVGQVLISHASWHLQISEDIKAHAVSVAELLESGSARPLPVRRVEWRDTQITLHTPTRTAVIPSRGFVELRGPASYVDIRGTLFSEEFHVHASRRGGRLWASLIGAGASPAKRNWVTATARSLDLVSGREIELRLRGHRLSISAATGNHRVAFADIQVKLDLHIVGDEVRDALGEVTASSGAMGDLEFAALRLAFRRNARDLDIAFSGRVEQCEGALRGTLSPHPKLWSSSGPFEGEWRLAGVLPESLRSRIADAGVIIKKARLLRADGSVTAVQTDAGWAAKISSAKVAAAARSLAFTEHGLVIHRPQATMHFDAEVNTDGGSIVLRKGSAATAGQFRWRALRGTRSLRSLPSMTLRVGNKAATWHWRDTAHRVQVPSLIASFQATLTYPNVRIQNLRGTMTVATTKSTTPGIPRIRRSMLRADALRIGKIEIPSVTARAQGGPSRLRIAGSAQFTETAKLVVSTVLSRKGSRWVCPSQVRLPMAQIDRGDRLSRLIESVANVSAAGKLSAKAQVDVCGTSPQGKGTLQLHKVEASHRGESFAVFGLDGLLTFSSLAPLVLPEWQQLDWTSLELGDQRFGRGSVNGRLASPPLLELRRLELETGAGLFWTSAFTLNPKHVDIDTTVFASGVQLKKWLPIVSRGRLRGSGRLSGQIGVRLQSKPELQVDFKRGTLRSDGKGHFTVVDRRWLQSALERSAQGMGLEDDKSALIKDRVIGALADFQYEKLVVRVEERKLEPTLSLHMRGKGRKMRQELDLTVNVGGFAAILNSGAKAWFANKDARK